jgi:hypothetical protein
MKEQWKNKISLGMHVMGEYGRSWGEGEKE